MGVLSDNAIIGASGQATGYDIPYSLRLTQSPRSILSRTMNQTGSSTAYFTYSHWVKRCDSTTGHLCWWRPYAAASTAGVECSLGANGTFRFNFWTGSASEADRYSTEQYRDPSAWYHFVLQINGATMAFYMNNVLVDMSTAGTITGRSWGVQSGDTFKVASAEHATWNGYITATHFIEGQTLAPSNFAELNEATGQWVPKEYEGTFTGNSFHLDYADSSDLGNDVSGLGNDFTLSNIAATDQSLDTPTNNYCTMNPLDKSMTSNLWTWAEGNLKVSGLQAGTGNNLATIGVSSGKWYWEVLYPTHVSANKWQAGVYLVTSTDSNDKACFVRPGATTPNITIDSGFPSSDSSQSGSLATFAAGDILGVALNIDGSSLQFYHNGSTYGTAISLTSTDVEFTAGIGDYSGTGAAAPVFYLNFGQDSSFAAQKTAQGNGGTGEDFYYTPPTGFVALNTDNLPDPAIALPTDHFNTVLWSGDSSYPRSITGTGFATDLLWFKTRNQTYDNIVLDSVRGLGSGNDKAIVTNLTSAEGIDSGNFNVSSFDSGGFTMASPSSTDTQNASGDTYVGWNWKAGGTAVSNTDGTITSSVSANTTAGFSIVSYTGSGAVATIGHGLSSAPELIIVKSRSTAGYDWLVYSDPIGNTKNLRLNLTNGEQTNSVFWNDTSPTASVFSVGTGGDVNIAATTFIAYCFNSVEDYSKVGSYSGNGSTDGTFIYTGFRPAYALIKCYTGSNTQEWLIVDNKRSTFNEVDKYLYANTNVAEGSAGQIDADFVSNGIKFRSTGGPSNASGRSYIYIAFAESPFKTSNAR